MMKGANMTNQPEPQIPTGRGYHWSAAQREAALNATLDAREAWRISMCEPEFTPQSPDTSGIPLWSEVCPGVPVGIRQADLDELAARSRVQDAIGRRYPDVDDDEEH